MGKLDFDEHCETSGFVRKKSVFQESAWTCVFVCANAFIGKEFEIKLK